MLVVPGGIEPPSNA